MYGFVFPDGFSDDGYVIMWFSRGAGRGWPVRSRVLERSKRKIRVWALGGEYDLFRRGDSYSAALFPI